MTEAEEYMAFTKGDELAIIQILETCNCSKGIISKIQNRLHYMQKHSCMYGKIMGSIGKPLSKEKKDYLNLLEKYEKSIKINKYLKKELTYEQDKNKKLSKMLCIYERKMNKIDN